MSRTTGSGSGNGDRCPLNPEHGSMFVLQPGDRQYCAHQSHDPRSKNHPLGAAPATRNIWPTGHISFNSAVVTYTAPTTPADLPEIDMEAFLA